MRRNSSDLVLASCGIICLILAHFIPQTVASWFDDLPSRYSLMLAPEKLKTAPVVAVAVDEESLRRFDQRWPLSRSIYARLVRDLDAEGARVIAFDLFFQGQSVDPQQDRDLADALCAAKAATIIGYTYDFKTQAMQQPLEQISGCARYAGWLYAPLDADGRIRRNRVVFRDAQGKVHYGFSAALAAAYLNIPVNQLLARTPVSSDGTFWITYLLRPGRSSIPVVSLAALLNDRAELKERLGSDFLKDKLCLVYPAADINHDRYRTPAGTLDGGWIHLNAAWNMAAGRTIVDMPLFTFVLALVSLVLTFFVLRSMDVSDRRGLLVGWLFVCAVIFLLGFWLQIVLAGFGLRFDYGRVSVFTLLFFAAGWLAQQAVFLKQLASVKDKVAVDPLRHLYTWRYFLYRLDMESRRRFLGRSLFLVSVNLAGLKNELDDADMQKAGLFWQRCAAFLKQGAGFWSGSGPEGICGAFVSDGASAEKTVRQVILGLQSAARSAEFALNIKAGYVEVKRELPLGQIVTILPQKLDAASGQVTRFQGADFSEELLGVYAQAGEEESLVEGLAEDVEAKNRELVALFAQLKKEHGKTKEAFFQIIESLVNALEARDPYTQGHSRRVAQYSKAMAEDMGWLKEDLEKIWRAALLHDLGKIGIPDSILHKDGKLSDEEFDFIKKHEVIAVNILKPLKDFEEILPWILYHHERWDGKGYPHGLAGKAIPAASQIISLADVYDALTTGRDYKKAVVPQDSIQMLRNGSGSQFDPDLVERFIALVARQQPQK